MSKQTSLSEWSERSELERTIDRIQERAREQIRICRMDVTVTSDLVTSEVDA